MTKMTDQDLVAVAGGFDTFGCTRDVALGAVAGRWLGNKAGPVAAAPKAMRVLGAIDGGLIAYSLSPSCKSGK